MNNKGLTLVELLITIVIMGILATFSIVAIGDALENSRRNAFVENANIIVAAATDSYMLNSDIWEDDVATLRELLTTEYLENIGEDPWGRPYDLDETYVSVTEVGVGNGTFISRISLDSSTTYSASNVNFNCKLVSQTAIIGYDAPLHEFTKSDIVFLENQNTIIENITAVFENDLEENTETSDGDDEITIDNDLQSGTTLTTNGGDDTLVIGDDIEDGSTVNMGDGNDILTMDGEVRDASNVDTGEGDDILTIKDDIQNNSEVLTGTGNDTVTVGDDLQSGGILNTGDGNDTIEIKDDLEDATLEAGEGNDTVSVDTIKKDSTLNAGADNDEVYIRDVSSSFDGNVNLGSGDDTLTIDDHWLRWTDGTYNGGSGTDTLILTNTSLRDWNRGVSDLFSNFEIIILEDTTINS